MPVRPVHHRRDGKLKRIVIVFFFGFRDHSSFVFVVRIFCAFLRISSHLVVAGTTMLYVCRHVVPLGGRDMGAITPRKRKDGSVAYLAQLVIKRDGKILHRYNNTFDRNQAAAAWLEKREKELAKPGALDSLKAGDPHSGRCHRSVHSGIEQGDGQDEGAGSSVDQGFHHCRKALLADRQRGRGQVRPGKACYRRGSADGRKLAVSPWLCLQHSPRGVGL